MLAEPGIAASVPHDSIEERAEKTIFSNQSSIFILNTHLSQTELDDVEDRVVRHGGNITYSPSEASLFLGKVGQKKRAVLELRRCGIWTEELQTPKPNSSVSNGTDEPPQKRQRHGKLEHEADEIDGNTDVATDKVQRQDSLIMPESDSEEPSKDTKMSDQPLPKREASTEETGPSTKDRGKVPIQPDIVKITLLFSEPGSAREADRIAAETDQVFRDLSQASSLSREQRAVLDKLGEMRGIVEVLKDNLDVVADVSFFCCAGCHLLRLRRYTLP